MLLCWGLGDKIKDSVVFTRLGQVPYPAEHARTRGFYMVTSIKICPMARYTRDGPIVSIVIPTLNSEKMLVRAK
jgi:hypothetical protein